MTKIKKSTPIGREAYLKKFIETAERLGMHDEAYEARREYIAILDRELTRCVVSAARAILPRNIHSSDILRETANIRATFRNGVVR